MSLKPGIGADFMHEVASTLLSLKTDFDDVPESLQHGSRKLPLGRYLRNKLRPLVGLEPGTPPGSIERIQAELLPLRESAFDSSRSFKTVAVEADDQKVLNMDTRRKIFSKPRKL